MNRRSFIKTALILPLMTPFVSLSARPNTRVDEFNLTTFDMVGLPDLKTVDLFSKKFSNFRDEDVQRLIFRDADGVEQTPHKDICGPIERTIRIY